MKRECFTLSKHSCVCAELFTDDSFEQNLTVRSLLGLSSKPRRLAFKKVAVPTILNFPMESCKPAFVKQTTKNKRIMFSEQRANNERTPRSFHM